MIHYVKINSSDMAKGKILYGSRSQCLSQTPRNLCTYIGVLAPLQVLADH